MAMVLGTSQRPRNLLHLDTSASHEALAVVARKGPICCDAAGHFLSHGRLPELDFVDSGTFAVGVISGNIPTDSCYVSAVLSKLRTAQSCSYNDSFNSHVPLRRHLQHNYRFDCRASGRYGHRRSVSASRVFLLQCLKLKPTSISIRMRIYSRGRPSPRADQPCSTVLGLRFPLGCAYGCRCRLRIRWWNPFRCQACFTSRTESGWWTLPDHGHVWPGVRLVNNDHRF